MKTYHALYDSYGATLRIEASAPHVARILAAQRMGVPESHRCLIAIVDPDAAGGAGYLARKAKLASWMPPSACTSMPWCDHCQCYHYSTARCVTKNPEGWREVDGVYLPSVADWHDKDNELAREGNAWAKIDQNDLDKVHECWMRNGRSE